MAKQDPGFAGLTPARQCTGNKLRLEKPNETCKSLVTPYSYTIRLHHQKIDDNFKRSRVYH